jgi:hypothetical protein
MAGTADTADIMANTANILARYHREADAGSAEAGRNSAAPQREDTAAGAAAAGVAETGAAVTASSSAVDMVIRTGVGTLLGAGAFLTRTTAIIHTSIIRMTVAPYQEGNSMGPDSGRALHCARG